MCTIRWARALALILLSSLVLAMPVFAGETTSEADIPLEAAIKAAQWTTGPATAQLLGVADLKLPEGFGPSPGRMPAGSPRPCTTRLGVGTFRWFSQGMGTGS